MSLLQSFQLNSCGLIRSGLCWQNKHIFNIVQLISYAWCVWLCHALSRLLKLRDSVFCLCQNHKPHFQRGILLISVKHLNCTSLSSSTCSHLNHKDRDRSLLLLVSTSISDDLITNDRPKYVCKQGLKCFFDLLIKTCPRQHQSFNTPILIQLLILY